MDGIAYALYKEWTGPSEGVAGAIVPGGGEVLAARFLYPVPFRMRAGHRQEMLLDELDDLIIAVAERRDRAAFRMLFERFAPRVKAFTLRRGADGQLAEEVVQETMVRIWQKAGQFDPAKARASTWIFTIARNLHIDLLRRTRRPEPDLDDPALVPDDQPSGFDLVRRSQDAGRLTAALRLLPEEQRAVLELAFFEELTHPEVAERLALPLGTVKSRIRLAFNRIRSELGDE